MWLTKYLATRGHATRRGAAELIKSGQVYLNGRPAITTDRVGPTDRVEVRYHKTPAPYTYFIYHKPRGEVTEAIARPSGLFPLGRLDRDSRGLIILTDDGRLTERLLAPDKNHEKEYVVTTREPLRPADPARLAGGVRIGDAITRPCHVEALDRHTLRIILTEGKKHQIRRMCDALGYTVADLLRTRIMNIKLGDLAADARRPLVGRELSDLLTALGLI